MTPPTCSQCHQSMTPVRVKGKHTPARLIHHCPDCRTNQPAPTTVHRGRLHVVAS